METEAHPLRGSPGGRGEAGLSKMRRGRRHALLHVSKQEVPVTPLSTEGQSWKSHVQETGCASTVGRAEAPWQPRPALPQSLLREGMAAPPVLMCRPDKSGLAISGRNPEQKE